MFYSNDARKGWDYDPFAGKILQLHWESQIISRYDKADPKAFSGECKKMLTFNVSKQFSKSNSINAEVRGGCTGSTTVSTSLISTTRVLMNASMQPL